MNELLHPKTRLGHVHLTVSDLDRSLNFYQTSFGMQLHWREDGSAGLGAGGSDILQLSEKKGAVHMPRHAGLYHFAILTPSRKALGMVLQNFRNTNTQISGWADHLVSEAIYLDDPDGNGIEIYRDRPREQWPHEADGSLRMANDPLDYRGILAEAEQSGEDWTGLHPDTILGHMHLHVSYLPESVAFYENVVGLETQLLWGASAGFMSAGGYHHHLGLNTWNGVGAPPKPPGTVGLEYFTVHLANPDERDALQDRVQRAGLIPFENEAGLDLQDPAGNTIRFITEKE